MDDEQFELMVQAGIQAIPEKFLCLLDNVAVVIEDEPTESQKQKLRLGKHMTLYGLYQGVPHTSRGANYTGVLPDKITIFKNPILAAAHTQDDVRRFVTDTVWHEIAHHFGLDEKRVRTAEQRRRKK